MIRTPLAEALIEARHERRMSQRDVAYAAGVPSGSYFRIESDGFVPGSEMLCKLASVLDIHDQKLQVLARLSKGKADMLSQYKNLREVFNEALYQMTTEERRDTLELIDKRIGLWQEDPKELAHNLKEFLLGRVGLEEEPENGLRPLIHYVSPWSQEIDGR